MDYEGEQMEQYWPMAMTEDGQILHTNDSADTIAECIAQFELWESHYHYKIKEAWIDHNKNRTFYVKKWLADRKIVLGANNPI